jgi:hypothetical protein
VIARPESWSRPADGIWLALATALAGLVFLGGFFALHHGFYQRNVIIDTAHYQDYGDAVLAGNVPYRDFQLEYPPGALPVFVLPAIGHAHRSAFNTFNREFETVMALCGLAALGFMALAIRALGGGAARLARALGLAAVAPPLLGTVVLYHFDLWPAALTVASLTALLVGRSRLGLGVLGLAAAAKLYPALLLPPALVYVWRKRGRREALVAGAVCGAVLAICFVPFLVLAPGGVWHSVTVQMGRPLQIESLGAGFMLAGYHLFGLGLTVRTDHGSQNFVGPGADTVATVSTGLELAAVALVWIWFAFGPAERERLLRGFAGIVCAFVAFGKVLSPQFLIWLVPLVPLVRGRRGIAASALLALALVLTQLWFPYRYFDLFLRLDERASWLVLARDLVLVVLTCVLVVATRRGRESLRS